jgi:NAD(P)-dependent dehydrogenase (short-subunit alcohol dehydrogenase family)
MDITATTALVTGTSRGLGLALVARLLRGGAKVYATARKLGGDTGKAFPHQGKLVHLPLDVTDQASVTAAAAAASDVNLLINNAGCLKQLSLAEAGDISSLKEEMEVNVFGVARMSLAFSSVIERNGGGAILNVLSTTGLLPFPPFGTYSASKAAAMSLTYSMRWDYTPKNIRVSGVYVGLMDTKMVQNIRGVKLLTDDVASAIVRGIETDQLDICVDPGSANLFDKYQSAYGGSIEELFDYASFFRRLYPSRQ